MAAEKNIWAPGGGVTFDIPRGEKYFKISGLIYVGRKRCFDGTLELNSRCNLKIPASVGENNNIEPQNLHILGGGPVRIMDLDQYLEIMNPITTFI